MSKAEFTPGPLRANGLAIESEQGTVAYMGVPALYAGDTAGMCHNWKANQPLFIAAPDLYEALRDASDWLADDCEPDGGIDPDLANLRRTILAALSKARGET